MAGFKYVGTDSQGDVTGKVKTFYVTTASDVIGIGDVVLVDGTAHTDGRASVDLGTANTANTGVVVGIAIDSMVAGENLTTNYLASGASGTIMVNTDPFALYEVEVANGPLAVTDVQLNAPLVATAGTVSGVLFTSNMKVNATGKATTATLPFRVVALKEDASGTLGNKAIVRVNASTSNIGATGI